MRQNGVKGLSTILVFSLLTISSWSLAARSSLAQETCAAPKPGEYLLLIVSNTPEEQKLVQRTLPNDINSEVCRYLSNLVTRVGGFDDQLIAEDWAAYLQDKVKLPAYVVKQEVTQVPRPSPNLTPVVRETPPSSPSKPESTRYNPQPLGSGYAVLVDYFNQPELALQLRTVIGGDVGLVSYGQRPYLLVEYTTNSDKATATLKQLSSRGFWSMLVDSNRVTVISPAIKP
ncbi:conserved exported hypothetical protein [Planktothrix serta PCC 8927]|uniref:SPOR domain-containing protein n=1 Tax=Planktothrix serta PCC 8927 TaxID=671068 RepID=A0A7Z9BSS8_9CYAN|nr:hypothetical protein [Planktothrix serta]VXD18085.1 conserved exported hypothetical protein [Planktothrix serta PCC 8927]